VAARDKCLKVLHTCCPGRPKVTQQDDMHISILAGARSESVSDAHLQAGPPGSGKGSSVPQAAQAEDGGVWQGRRQGLQLVWQSPQCISNCERES
jgi:hypothetical protein